MSVRGHTSGHKFQWLLGSLMAGALITGCGNQPAFRTVSSSLNAADQYAHTTGGASDSPSANATVKGSAPEGQAAGNSPHDPLADAVTNEAKAAAQNDPSLDTNSQGNVGQSAGGDDKPAIENGGSAASSHAAPGQDHASTAGNNPGSSDNSSSPRGNNSALPPGANPGFPAGTVPGSMPGNPPGTVPGSVPASNPGTGPGTIPTANPGNTTAATCWCAGGPLRPAYILGSEDEARDCAAVEAADTRRGCNADARYGVCACGSQGPGWQVDRRLHHCQCIQNPAINELPRDPYWTGIPQHP